ncbi:Arylsulfatase [Planctomycetes bacterium CA13]|uniref:Arylsulfatase n=1 Tax=Novipirellula herctigrandis TaxID=2527986 RepID=A0A5C5ZAR2_9BACT|nr:Arylsulfatase [Planctomycetes bacterium CA13]
MKIFLAVLCVTFGLGSALAEADQRPNIVLVFADDLGWKDVGYQGSDVIETPHLDHLAKQGMVFSAAYAAAGNCAPSRACLLSGTYTPRHHIYAVGSTGRGKLSRQRLIPIPNRSGLAKDNVTFADALKAAGYVTGHFGKWHLAGKDGALPTEQGFDVSFDSFGDGELKEGSESNKTGPPTDPKGVFTLTRKACEFMESNKDRPFFCYLAHHAIHGPLQGRPETVAKFQAKTPEAQHKHVMYAACTYDFDASVGMLIQKLDELDLAENTLLVFTSDNGATPLSPQEPLRGNKGCYYEGGIREPFIVRWPGVTQPGTRCDVPVINVDLYPTFLDAAGASSPNGKVLDGESLLPLFKGEGALNRSSIFWHFPGYLDRPVIRGRELDVRTGFRTRPVSVIHKGDWKLHLYHEEWQLDGGRKKIDGNNAVELYDLKNDIGERTNLANVNPTKRDELLDDLLNWFGSADALVAHQPNPKYQTAAVDKNNKGKDNK